MRSAPSNSNAVDYVLKPVEAARLRKTLDRARDRLEREEPRTEDWSRMKAAAEMLESDSSSAPLERIPVRKRDGILLVPVSQISSIVADGELLHIRTLDNETYTINYRLRDLEARIDRTRFVRLGRGTIVSIATILKIVPMPGRDVHCSPSQQSAVSCQPSSVPYSQRANAQAVEPRHWASGIRHSLGKSDRSLKLNKGHRHRPLQFCPSVGDL